MSVTFNYIIPIYNKEDILQETLAGIEKCARSESKIIMIVDGCTDRSETIVDEFIKNSSHSCEKILTPNVHMLLSVNAGLRKVQRGYSVIMQDDIILKDVDVEKKVIELYHRLGERLGIISFRYGSNISLASLKERLNYFTVENMIKEIDFIKGPSDYADFPSGEFGKFYPRMNSINGPNIIPWHILNTFGLLDEKLAPYGYDDPEYCLRNLKDGKINGLFPIEYTSEIEWGGTRRSKQFQKEVKKIHKRNRIYIYIKHGKFLINFLKTNKIYDSNESI